MRKFSLGLYVAFALCCLPALAADEAKEMVKPLFAGELSEHIFLLNQMKGCDSEAPYRCDACKQISYCCERHCWEDQGVGHRVACRKNVGTIEGQKWAYACVEGLFKDADDFFARFFAIAHLQAINKKLLQPINRNLLGCSEPPMPEESEYGKLRQLERTSLFGAKIIPSQGEAGKIMAMDWARAGAEMNFCLKSPKAEARSEIPFNKNGYRRFVIENSSIYWTDESFRVTQKFYCVERLGGEVLVDRLEQLLSDIKAALAEARGNSSEIIKTAAAAHMGLLHLDPFCGANKRTARVVMNAILAYSGLPAVWFDDRQAYNDAIFADLKNPSSSEHFRELLQGAVFGARQTSHLSPMMLRIGQHRKRVTEDSRICTMTHIHMSKDQAGLFRRG